MASNMNGDTSSLHQQIGEIVVLPSPELLEESVGVNDLQQCIQEYIDYINVKIEEYQKIIQQNSVVSFTANMIQSRIVSTEFGTKLSKVYEALEVKKMDEFDRKLQQIGLERRPPQTADLVVELKSTFQKWQQFLVDIDTQLDKLVGPERSPDVGDEIQLMSQNKMFRSGTLLSYLKNSAYELMLIEIAASFNIQECYEHLKKMFDELNEFRKLNCDILLLTKRPTQGGGGFLKLIGIPFRIILNEKEAFTSLLAHRQSVVALAGLKAVHIYAEFICNEHALEIAKVGVDASDSAKSEAMRSVLGSQSGCALIDRRGRILYTHLCVDNKDWPNVEVLLQQVRANKRPVTSRYDIGSQPPADPTTPIALINTATSTQVNTTNPLVAPGKAPVCAMSASEKGAKTAPDAKRKCCTCACLIS